MANYKVLHGNKQQVNVRVDPCVMEDLEMLCLRHGRSQSQFIRLAIDRLVRSQLSEDSANDARDPVKVESARQDAQFRLEWAQRKERLAMEELLK